MNYHQSETVNDINKLLKNNKKLNKRLTVNG